MKISEIFHVYCGKRITEEDAYNHTGTIPCVTAQTENDGIAWYVNEQWVLNDVRGRIINEPCVTWSKDGYAGKLFYRNYPFFPNDHCGVLTLKQEYKDDVDLEWFAYACEPYIMSFVTSSQGQGMLYKQQMENISIDIPDIDVQKDFLVQYNRYKETQHKLCSLLSRVEQLLNATVEFDGDCETILMRTLSTLNKGSNTISEQMIYEHYSHNSIPVFSSATHNKGLMGYVSTSYFDNQAVKRGNANELTWSTNGNAGKVFFRDAPYLYSEKCGRIVIKEEYIEKINKRYLQMFLNQNSYKYTTSTANNGKLDIVHMAHIPVVIPEKSIQDDIAEKYVILEKIYDTISPMIK